MSHELLVGPTRLSSLFGSGECVIVDCRFELADPGAGYKKYLEAHIPGAVYAHLDNDLSNMAVQGRGRHPLPEPEAFAGFLAASGWRPGKLLVAYDDVGGSIAARLWWLMRYLGHDNAALLDGGLPAWKEAGLPLEAGVNHVSGEAIAPFSICNDLVVSTDEVADALENHSIVLADVRDPERFNGEFELIDPVAGHVPGARNYPLQQNLREDGSFKPPRDIREQFGAMLGDRDPSDLVHMCGSGVTACQNIFAAELAGISGTRLYNDSWSGWIHSGTRPIEKSS